MAAAAGSLMGGQYSRNSSEGAAATALALEELRAGIRASLPSSSAAAALLLGHRLRNVDGDMDGIVADDDLLRVVLESAQGVTLKNAANAGVTSGGGGVSGKQGATGSDIGWCDSNRLPESLGYAVKLLRSQSANGGGALQEGSTNILHRVPGVKSEDFIAWVLGGGREGGGGGADDGGRGVERVLLDVPTSHVPKIIMPPPPVPPPKGFGGSAAGGSSYSGTTADVGTEDNTADRSTMEEETGGDGAASDKQKKKGKGPPKMAFGRPVFQGDTPEARFAAFRSHWEGRYGEGAKKEMAMDSEVPPEGPTWTRATPVEFRVLHLSVAPPRHIYTV